MIAGLGRNLDKRVEAAAILLAAMSTSCSTALQVDVRDLLNEASTNEIALLEKYKYERLSITGTVERVGLQKQQAFVHRQVGLGTHVSQKKQQQYAYAFLAPGDGMPGKALCFFKLSERADAAQLRQGDTARLECDLQEYGIRDGVPVLVLNGCQTAR